MGQQFIIGQPRPCRRGRRQIGHVARRMGLLQGVGEIGPVFLFFLIGINPFANLWRTRQRGTGGFVHQLLRNPAGQRIHRFKRWNIVRLCFGNDEIGVDHLGVAIKELDPSRHDTARPFGHLPLPVIPTGMEKNQLKGGGTVLDMNTVGTAFIRRRAMRPNGNSDRHRRGQDRVMN